MEKKRTKTFKIIIIIICLIIFYLLFINIIGYLFFGISHCGCYRCTCSMTEEQKNYYLFKGSSPAGENHKCKLCGKEWKTSYCTGEELCSKCSSITRRCAKCCKLYSRCKKCGLYIKR